MEAGLATPVPFPTYVRCGTSAPSSQYDRADDYTSSLSTSNVSNNLSPKTPKTKIYLPKLGYTCTEYEYWFQEYESKTPKRVNCKDSLLHLIPLLTV